MSRKHMLTFLGYALSALVLFVLAALVLRILWAPAEPPDTWP